LVDLYYNDLAGLLESMREIKIGQNLHKEDDYDDDSCPIDYFSFEENNRV